MDRSRLKHRLFGLNPKKVNAYLRQLKHLQDKEWAELEEKFKTAQAEHERLQREWEALQAGLRQREQDGEYMALATKRADAAVHAMHVQTQQELADLQRKADQMREEHERKIERIHQQTEHYSQVLQELLQEFGLTMQKFNAASFDLPQDIAGVPFAAREEARVPKNDKVVQFRVKSLTERQQIAEALQRTGTVAGEDEEVRPDHIALVETASTVLALEEESSSDVQETSAFWGNIQSYVSAGPAVPVADVMSPEPEAWTAPALQPTPVAPVTPVLQAAESVDEPATAEADNSEAGKESGALSAEIMSIRNRYIVGKIAGEDLHDADGRLIVAKSGLITAEIVDLAEKAGRLPDLIVNMKIAGMGDEQTS